MQEMKPCPFCGNPKVKLVKNARFYTFSYGDKYIERVKYSVRCGVCYARGGLARGLVGDYGNCENDIPAPYRNKIATDEELQAKAIELWNERVK